MTIRIADLELSHRAEWEMLARGYKAFYGTPTTDAQYELAWSRLCARDRIRGLAALKDGRLVGIAHYLFHTSIWAEKVCYLQDLFTAPEARGQGIARRLIEVVAERARAEGASRYYWHTQEHNAVARALYDRVGKFNAFIRYDYPLDGG